MTHMVRINSLNISGYKGRQVPNTLFSNDESPEALAIVLPGYGYTAHMPLLYYTIKVLTSRGADVLSIDYAYNKLEEYQSASRRERDQWLQAEVMAATDAAFARAAYARTILVGKSMGTEGIAHLLETHSRFGNSMVIWLTPVLSNEHVKQWIQECLDRSVIVIGTADPFYEPEYINDLKAIAQDRVLVVEGADHSMEIQADVSRNVEILGSIMAFISTFLNERE